MSKSFNDHPIDSTQPEKSPRTRISTIYALKVWIKTVGPQELRMLAVCGLGAVFIGIISVLSLARNDIHGTEATVIGFLGGFFVTLIVMISVGLYRIRQSEINRLYISQFCLDNNLDFQPKLALGDDVSNARFYAATLFQGGRYRKIKDRCAAKNGEYEFGNYEYQIGVGGLGAKKYTWGYIRIPLANAIPHLFLEPVRKGTQSLTREVTNTVYDFDQKLQLEGDFNNYFTLYCPRQYERDALYVITPDLMAIFLDNGADYHIEIIKNQLYVYGKEFKFNQKAGLGFISRVMNNILPKVERQTRLYKDEKAVNPMNTSVEPNSADSDNVDIAQSGRRLRGAKIDIAAGIIGAVIAAAVILGQILRSS